MSMKMGFLLLMVDKVFSLEVLEALEALEILEALEALEVLEILEAQEKIGTNGNDECL
ncbi:MAG: hypothetical protein K5787_18565 [Lentisphaeria bacterium]|nr:hypothetical protein [Lentisphaeria bacterium]